MNVNITPFDSIRAPHLGQVDEVVNQAEESALAMLSAENASLRGRLAGRTPSPTPSNGGSEPNAQYVKSKVSGPAAPVTRRRPDCTTAAGPTLRASRASWIPPATPAATAPRLVTAAAVRLFDSEHPGVDDRRGTT